MKMEPPVLLKFPIREQDPLKQGLKLFSACLSGEVKRIREQDPLKQGLKHKSGEWFGA